MHDQQRDDLLCVCDGAGGLKLIELNASGTKVKGYVYANGQRLAVQAVWAGGHSVSYYHTNPGTKSWSETSNDRYAFRREMGPLGEELGTYDPYIMLESPSYTDVHSGPVFLEGGDPFDFGSGCGTIDGLPASCSELQMRLEAGTLEAYYPGPRESDPSRPANDPNPTKWVPVMRPIGNLGLGIYVILMPTLLDSVESSSFGSVSFTVPQNPEGQDLWKAGKDELKKQIEEREPCAALFGGKEKAVKALDKLKPNFVSLPSPAIATISGNTVKLDPTRFTSAGIPLKVATFTGLRGGHEVYSTRLLNLTGADFAAFALGHEFGHKMKSYNKKNDKDGFDDIKVALNNEQLRSACFNEY